MQSAHHSTWSDARECLVFGSIAIALVLASPFLALALFMVRPFVIAAALLALVAVISPVVITPRLRGRWQADVAPESGYRGLRLARDVSLHPGHSWAWISDEEIVVGVDDIAQAEIGPIEGIDFPPLGTRLHQGEPLCQVRHGGRVLELPSPVSGEVIRLNDRLLDQPGLINRRPFSLGWVARIRPDEHLVDDRRRLRSGGSAWRWFCAEVDRVLQGVPDTAVPLHDPERMAEVLFRAIDDETWHRHWAAQPARAIA